MKASMQGLFKTAPGDRNMEIRNIPVPEPGSNQVLIEVKAAGICGSDLHIYHWDIGYAMRPPMIVGHECSGVIVETGKEVQDWKAGDRVTAEPSAIVCGTCRYCRTGAYNLCPERKVMGYWVNGVFAEYVVVDAIRLHKLPDSISFDEGALTEPLACCVHAVHELTGVEVGDIVVVTGPGAIGMLTAQLAKAEGAVVVMVGTSADEKRLQKAEELGVDAVLNLEKENPVEKILNITEGYGADIVFECAGAAPAAALGLELVRKQGKYTQVGLFGKPIMLDFEKIAYKELTVKGSLAQRWTAWKRTIKIMDQGKINLKAVISDKLPLSQWQEAFDRFEKKQGLKILLDPKL
jgi:L-iditol 2-dehydrogenase